MAYENNRKAYFVFILGTVLTLIALADITWWIYLAIDDTKSLDETKKAYLNIFPVSLQNTMLLTFANIAILLLAFFCFRRTLKMKLLKYSSIALSTLCIILAAWMAFSLM